MQIGGRNSVVDSILFKPGVNNTLAALDDSTSMFSVAARDLLDSSGRTYMEYKRDPHGGRERLLEEFFTFVIWGFGVRTMKQCYDAGILNAKKFGIKLPDLDIDLLPKAKVGSSEGLQKLDEKLVGQFAEKFKHAGQYHDLLAVLKSPQLQKAYRASSIYKFMLASGVPALAIALGVPTFNQWLTRQRVAAEKSAKPQNKQAQPSPNQAAPGGIKTVSGSSPAPLNKSVPTAGKTDNQLAAPAVAPVPPANFKGQAFPHANPAFLAANSYASMNSFQAKQARQPGQPAQPATQFASAQNSPKHKHHNGQVQFGGLPDVASAILQNERWNTLLIDGTISGGRFYMGRKLDEKIEIAVREATIIAFLYWIQRPLQNAVSNALGKFWSIPSNMEFKTIQYLRKHSDYAKTPEKFHQDFQKGVHEIADWMGKKLTPAIQQPSAKQVLGEILKNSENKEKALLEAVYDYFLHHRGANKNMILETAIDSGWIPTFNKQAGAQSFGNQMKGVLHEMNPIKNQELTKNQFLDLTKKIDTKSIFSLMESLESLSEKTLHQPQQLEQMLKKTMRLRAGAWFASNAVCFTFLSIVIPALQHYITYKRTGKNYFPGLQQEAAAS